MLQTCCIEKPRLKQISKFCFKFNLTLTYKTRSFYRGGTCLGRWYGDVPRSLPPFFRLVDVPQPTNIPSMRRSCAPPPISIFFFKSAFSVLFLAKITAFKMHISKIFIPKTPNFSKKSASQTILLETWVAHTYHKEVECPWVFLSFQKHT